MTIYAVKRSLPGITMEQLGGAQKAVKEVNKKASIPFDEIIEVLDFVP